LFDADTLCHAVTLTFDPLTLKVRGTSNVTWSKCVRNFSEIEQSPAELLIILLIFAHVMLRCDLDLWPLDLELLQHFGCPMFELCTKFERNWIIRGPVIDNLAPFRMQVFGGYRGGAELTELSQECVDPITSPNFPGTQGDHRSIALLFLISDILLRFETRAARSW